MVFKKLKRLQVSRSLYSKTVRMAPAGAAIWVVEVVVVTVTVVEGAGAVVVIAVTPMHEHALE
jgi:hypothetical protein